MNFGFSPIAGESVGELTVASSSFVYCCTIYTSQLVSFPVPKPLSWSCEGVLCPSNFQLETSFFPRPLTAELCEGCDSFRRTQIRIKRFKATRL